MNSLYKMISKIFTTCSICIFIIGLIGWKFMGPGMMNVLDKSLKKQQKMMNIHQEELSNTFITKPCYKTMDGIAFSVQKINNGLYKLNFNCQNTDLNLSSDVLTNQTPIANISIVEVTDRSFNNDYEYLLKEKFSMLEGDLITSKPYNPNDNEFDSTKTYVYSLVNENPYIYYYDNNEIIIQTHDDLKAIAIQVEYHSCIGKANTFSFVRLK